MMTSDCLPHQVTLRVYGATASRKDGNWREVGVRILCAALADACARHGRGVDVLHSHSPPGTHFVHVTSRIRKGAAASDASRALIGRAYTPDGHAVGPLWLGPLQSAPFLRRCLASCAADEPPPDANGGGAGRRLPPAPKPSPASSAEEELQREARKAFEMALADAPGLPPFSVHTGSRSPTALVEALAQHCRLSLAGYKQPRSFDFKDELPRTETGKLYKRLLREAYWQGQERRI